MVVPGGVDRSGTHRVIPALLWLMRRLSHRVDLHVFAMRGENSPGRYTLEGATVHNVGGGGRRSMRTLRALLNVHRDLPFDLIHAFWASGPGVPAAAAARWIRAPLLLHVTGGDLVALPGIGYGARLGAVGRTRVAFALASASRLTVPSGALARDLEDLGHTADRLPLGVDTAEWRPLPPRPRDPARPARLLHVGSLNPVKDQPTLLRVARRLADSRIDFTLDIVGGDTLDGCIQKMAASLGLDDRVRFHGFLTQDALRPVVAGADLLVMSSLHEADPIVALEAAALGVPTAGTRCGHIRDWEPDAALAVQPGDDAALARAVSWLLDNDARRMCIAAAAQTIVLREDADWSAERTLTTYTQLTGSDC